MRGTDYPGRELIVALPVRYLDDRLGLPSKLDCSGELIKIPSFAPPNVRSEKVKKVRMKPKTTWQVRRKKPYVPPDIEVVLEFLYYKPGLEHYR